MAAVGTTSGAVIAEFMRNSPQQVQEEGLTGLQLLAQNVRSVEAEFFGDLQPPQFQPAQPALQPVPLEGNNIAKALVLLGGALSRDPGGTFKPILDSRRKILQQNAQAQQQANLNNMMQRNQLAQSNFGRRLNLRMKIFDKMFQSKLKGADPIIRQLHKESMGLLTWDEAPKALKDFAIEASGGDEKEARLYFNALFESGAGFNAEREQRIARQSRQRITINLATSIADLNKMEQGSTLGPNESTQIARHITDADQLLVNLRTQLDEIERKARDEGKIFGSKSLDELTDEELNSPRFGLQTGEFQTIRGLREQIRVNENLLSTLKEQFQRHRFGGVDVEGSRKVLEGEFGRRVGPSVSGQEERMQGQGTAATLNRGTVVGKGNFVANDGTIVSMDPGAVVRVKGLAESMPLTTLMQYLNLTGRQLQEKIEAGEITKAEGNR